jgi:hypothetical protein
MVGFGGSGNTFIEHAFEFSQPAPLNLAHHLHTPVQALIGASLNLPTLVFFRKPINAVASLISRWYPEYDAEDLHQLLRDYVSFHETIYTVKDHCVFATFKECTTDLGIVISRVNSKFGTDFVPFAHTRENVAAIQSTQRQAKPGSARIHQPKAVVAELSRPAYSRDVAEAVAMHRRITEECWRSQL